MPLGILQVVVEPAQQDLLSGKAQELLQSLIIFQQSVQLRVESDIDLAEKTSADNLPDQTKNQVLLDLDDVARANVDNRTADTLCRLNDDVVVLSHVEGVECLDLLADSVQDTLIDCVGYTVVDELGQYETVLALVEHLKGIGGERQLVANVGISGKDGIDVTGEFFALILVDGVL